MDGPFYIVNPTSAAGLTGRLWSQLSSSSSHSYDFALTTGPMDAARLAARAYGAGARKIIAVGGDGTINEVLNGLDECGAVKQGNLTLGFLPCGTGCDLARTLALHGQNPARLMSSFEEATASELDYGVAQFQTHGGGEIRRLFANVSSMGFSAQVARAVSLASKRLGGKPAYLVGVAKTLFSLANPHVIVQVDGLVCYEGPTLLVAVANGRFFGGGMEIAPEARPDDGLLDVIVVTAMRRLEVMRYIGTIYEGKHVGLPWVRTARGKHVEVSSVDSVPLETDGEAIGTTDARFTVSDHRLSVLTLSSDYDRPTSV